MPYDITNFDSVGHDRYHHVLAKYKVDKWTPILGDPGAVNFHHEHSIVPAICAWVSEDGGPHSQYQNLQIMYCFQRKVWPYRYSGHGIETSETLRVHISDTRVVYDRY